MQLSAEKIGTVDISGYTSGKTLFIPVGELFSFLKINFNISKHSSEISGYFVDELNKYSINIPGNTAVIKNKIIPVSRKDFYITESDIYINSGLYMDIFGIKLVFDFNQLKVFLSSDGKLPAEIEIERELTRNKLESNRRETGETDFTIPRSRKILGVGMLDWMLSYSHTSPVNDYYSYSMSLGSEILGGDLNVFSTGNKDDFFNGENVNWRWRYADDKKFFRQGIVGNISLGSGLLSGTQGFQITNSPPVSRKSIGKYKIFDKTDPNWKVELYINNEFIDYTSSDNSGYFEFNVPLLYGSNYITLKYYGLSGEVRTEDRVIQVPFNFIPEKTVEYSVSGGTLKYGNHDAFSESSLFWGITQFLTAGSNLVYLNEPGLKKFYPGVNLSYRIFDNLVLSSGYFHNVKGTASLSLLLPSQIFTTLTFIRYGENDFFNPAEYKEEKNLTAYIPVSFKNFSTSFRINARNVLSQNYDFVFLNTGLFANYDRLQGSVITSGSWSKASGNYTETGLTSVFSLSYRILSDFLIRQQTETEHSKGRVTRTGIYFDKSIFKTGWLSVFVSRDFSQNSYYGGLTFRYDFSFGRYNSGYYLNNEDWYSSQTVSGSIGYDQFNSRIIMNNQNMVSRGGLSLIPFIDYNNNDIIDKNDRIINSGFNSSVNAGKLIKSEENDKHWYVDLNSYENYRLEVNPVSFDNPLLRPKYKSFSVATDPNHFKVVPIPVFISGMVSGNVLLNSESGTKGISMLKIILESLDGKILFVKSTFSDGEYIFDNIPPGIYRIYPESSELSRRSLSMQSAIQTVEIKISEDGDVIDGIDFLLTKEK
ncbi:MAG: hypothetical protein HY959_12560 [Ignavibacteriae bacterium]|nr:hypothetical protein [Ignavibacteriota bacterium]